MLYCLKKYKRIICGQNSNDNFTKPTNEESPQDFSRGHQQINYKNSSIV